MDRHPLLAAVEPAPHRDRASGGAVAFGLFAAPLAWIVQLCAGFAAALASCANDGGDGGRSTGLVLAALAAAIAVAALTASAEIWRRTRREAAGDAGAAIEAGAGRTRFLALWGIIASVVFLTAIVFTAVGLVGAPACGA